MIVLEQKLSKVLMTYYLSLIKGCRKFTIDYKVLGQAKLFLSTLNRKLRGQNYGKTKEIQSIYPTAL